MAGKAIRAAALALGLLGLGAEAQAPPEVRFAEITLRLVTTGERQPLQEAGIFTSSLPLGKAGTLHREVTVTNETRKTATTLALALTVTPTADDAGVLHCVVLSDVKPQEGELTSRAKDMTFVHPGQQVMELYADPATGSHLILSVSAHLTASGPGPSPASTMPPIRFLVKVEQWAGAQRAELETLQLQSLEGKSVSHDYSRKVPRWVEGSAGGADDQALDQLPVLDLSKSTPVIQAGQGFSIPISPSDRTEEAKKSGGKDKDKDKEGPPPRHLTWDREFYHLTLTPLSLQNGRLRLDVAVDGQILDPVTRKPLPVLNQRTEKTLAQGEPATFYITRETAGGPLGFAVWVVPQWGEDQPPPAPEPAPAPGAPPS